MKRRYLILVIGFVAFVAIVLGVLAMLPPTRSIFIRGNYDRIQDGMTLPEVEGIFGKKANSWRSGSDFPDRDFSAWWIDDEGYCGICFIDNRVSGKAWRDYLERGNCKPTFSHNIRRWLHLD